MKSDYKIKLFSLLVLFAIIISGLSIKNYLLTDSKNFNHKIDIIQTAIDKRQWKSAYNLSCKLNQDWEKSESIWALFINHHEIDNITIPLKETIQYINHKDQIESSVHLSELKEYIDHIPEMETLSFKNVF
jgi:hypothetical protein